MPKAEFPIGSLLPLVLAICSWQIFGTVVAEMAIVSPNGRAYSPVATRSIDMTDCTSAAKEKESPGQNSNDLPRQPSDLDETDGGLDNFNSDPSTRNNQGPPNFSGIDLETRAGMVLFLGLRQPERLPYNSCLREHIRERAPPNLG